MSSAGRECPLPPGPTGSVPWAAGPVVHRRRPSQNFGQTIGPLGGGAGAPAHFRRSISWYLDQSLHNARRAVQRCLPARPQYLEHAITFVGLLVRVIIVVVINLE